MMEQPRLPIYLLLDTSASMAGEPLEAMKQGLKALLSELKQDAQTREDGFLAMIAFDTIARQILPLTPIRQAAVPPLRAGGVSSLEGALRLLAHCLHNDLRPADSKPIVFLMTDGSWLEAAGELKCELEKLDIQFICCAAGARADLKSIQQLSPEVLLLNNLTLGSFSQYCIWSTT